MTRHRLGVRLCSADAQRQRLQPLDGQEGIERFCAGPTSRSSVTRALMM